MSAGLGSADARDAHPSADLRRRRNLTGLLIPADPDRVVTLSRVPDQIAEISEALGACLLDDVTVPLPDGGLVCVYRSEAYTHQPDNPRLAALLARLGVIDRQLQATLRGDALILGCTGTGAMIDLDVPAQVVAACVHLNGAGTGRRGSRSDLSGPLGPVW